MRPVAILILLLAMGLSACGGGSSDATAPAAGEPGAPGAGDPPQSPAGPVIASFAADSLDTAAGGPVRLTAVFSGGVGSIDQGIGIVSSGVPVETPAPDGRTFTLSVGNSSRTVQATATVAAVHLQVWNFDDPAEFGFNRQGATFVGGRIELVSSCLWNPPPMPGQTFDFTCWSGNAQTAQGEFQAAGANYTRLEIEFENVQITGDADSREISVAYRGKQARIPVNDSGVHQYLVVWNAPGDFAAYVDGVRIANMTVAGLSPLDASRLGLRVDQNGPRSSPATLAIDAVRVRAR